MSTRLRQVYIAKGARVYVSGMLSILLPIYLKVSGYSSLYVGLVLVAILGGNALSNITLNYFERAAGRRKLLLLFSALMAVSGTALAVGSGAVVILAACFLGNISSTGTEAGPFQSVEAGILPDLSGEGSAAKSFGIYNTIGYLASSVGAFSASAPDYFGGGLLIYRGLFAVFGVVGALLFVIYLGLRGIEAEEVPKEVTTPSEDSATKKEIVRLSVLLSADAFGGSFVSQYVMSYWFSQSYGTNLALLGPVFLVANLITAASVYWASVIATRLGNLRTMFSTHLISNAFLLLIPFAGSLPGSLLFLFARQSTSQMDVPPRQTLMGEMFGPGERVSAYAITNTARSISGFLGGPVSAAMFAVGFLTGPILAGGFSKMAYDFAIFGAYRKRFR